MSHPVITVHPEMPIQEALKLRREERVRRFPVADQRGRLAGIVSERDLLHAAPSDATSLSIWEVNVLVSKITVEKVMTRQVITITGDTPLEEAGGNIVALGTFLGESSENREVTIKVAGVNGKSLVTKIEPLVERVIDFRASW